jgi:hypothetical protein
MLTSLLLYIVAGWVMLDFFSGCVEGQLCYARVLLGYFWLSHWHFVTGISFKSGGGL